MNTLEHVLNNLVGNILLYFGAFYSSSFGHNWVQNDRLGLNFMFPGLDLIKKAVPDRTKSKIIEHSVNSTIHYSLHRLTCIRKCIETAKHVDEQKHD